MSKLKSTQDKLNSKLGIISTINGSSNDSTANVVLKDIPSAENSVGKTVASLSDKTQSKKENKKDIFSELVDVASKFMDTDKKASNSSNTSINSSKNKSASKIEQYALTAVDKTLGSAKGIAVKNLSEALFMGEGICGTESLFTDGTVTLKPSEFDFLNMLTIAPDSTCGEIIYEPISPDKNKEKVNRELYNCFSEGPYTFTSNNGNNLFTSTWDESNQRYKISGLTQGGTNVKVQDFITDYYTSMEFNDINDIVNTSMLLTIQGGSGCGDSTAFNKSINDALRLIDKLFSICGSPNDTEELKNQDPVGMFNETDEDIESYFDFNDVEGIDLDDEDARYRKVLRFKDCYNFEIPVDSSHMEDFVFLSKNGNIKKSINVVLEKVALDASQQSDGSSSYEDFLSNLLNSFILNLPKALVMSILSSKIFFPLSILYKIFKNGYADISISDLIQKLYKAIYKTIKDLFWLFIQEFWKLIKSELLTFVSELVSNIIKGKLKRYVTIVTSLISLLKQILETDMNNCYSLFQTILNTITNALSTDTSIKVPSVLLMLAGSLPGYSQERAHMNIMERIDSAGTPTSDLYGDSNDLNNIVKSIVDGHTEEEDTNSYVKIVLDAGTIPGPPTGGAIIVPGVNTGVGKKF